MVESNTIEYSRMQRGISSAIFISFFVGTLFLYWFLLKPAAYDILDDPEQLESTKSLIRIIPYIIYLTVIVGSINVLVTRFPNEITAFGKFLNVKVKSKLPEKWISYSVILLVGSSWLIEYLT